MTRTPVQKPAANPTTTTRSPTIQPGAVRAGATTAFICVGFGLVAALAGRAALDWSRTSTSLVASLFALIGFVLGGFRAGLGCPAAPLTNGMLAAVIGYAPLGIAQRLIAGRAVRPLNVLLAIFFAACFGVFGGVVATSAHRRRAASAPDL